jgi:hypothetical protein
MFFFILPLTLKRKKDIKVKGEYKKRDFPVFDLTKNRHFKVNFICKINFDL